MISYENKFKIQEIINKVSHSRCENLWSTTLLRSTVGLTDAEVLGVIMHIEMDFNISTNATIRNVYHLRTINDIYRIFMVNYKEKEKIKFKLDYDKN